MLLIAWLVFSGWWGLISSSLICLWFDRLFLFIFSFYWRFWLLGRFLFWGRNGIHLHYLGLGEDHLNLHAIDLGLFSVTYFVVVLSCLRVQSYTLEDQILRRILRLLLRLFQLELFGDDISLKSRRQARHLSLSLVPWRLRQPRHAWHARHA